MVELAACEEDGGVPLRLSAGGRDFISFALAREMVGTVHDEIMGARC